MNKIDTPVIKRLTRRVILAGVGVSLLVAIIIVIVVALNARGDRRPQEPSTPYPYHTEEVTFVNSKADVMLAGTLTLPSANGVYPAVVLISGSGPQTRDGEFAGHKPFLVLADYLTRQGLAVLRYDDRGFGKSTGNFNTGTSLDFSYDTESAIEYLKTRKEIQKDRIGLIGHSDGAMIAPMIAARSADVSFIVLLAGPGLPCAELLLERQELIERKVGLSEEEIRKSRAHNEQMIAIVANAENDETARAALTKFAKDNYNDVPDYAIPPGMSKDDFITRHINMMCTPWFRYLLAYDPAPVIARVKCPVLALNGDKDVQVPSKRNLEAIKNALITGQNANSKVLEVAGLNHAFQECETGMPDEYSKISQTLSPIVLSEIQTWIGQQLK